nr:uncharacterized protein LOC111514609 [Leptinotarsa decemlineata]
MLSGLWILAAIFLIEVHGCLCNVLDAANEAVDLKRDNLPTTSAENNGTIREIEGLLSEIFEIDSANGNGNGTLIEESRKKKNDNKEDKGFMEKMLPMMVMPFMVSTTMIPMMMISMFVMLVKSAFMGKIGLILMLVNMFRNRSNQGGVISYNPYSRNDDTKEAMSYYGYHGDEEYGAYVNKRRKRTPKY